MGLCGNACCEATVVKDSGFLALSGEVCCMLV